MGVLCYTRCNTSNGTCMPNAQILVMQKKKSTTSCDLIKQAHNDKSKDSVVINGVKNVINGYQ